MSFRRASQVAVGLTVAALMASATAFAAKPSSYSPTLGVSWPALASTSTSTAADTSYVISGCKYNGSLGGVTVVVYSPTAAAFAGQMPDANGCISLSNFSTQGAGHYLIYAYQTIKGKSTIVASTSFDR
jgi:hypothetical protein